MRSSDAIANSRWSCVQRRVPETIRHDAISEESKWPAPRLHSLCASTRKRTSAGVATGRLRRPSNRFSTVLERTERDFSDNEGMACDFAFRERIHEIDVVPSQVIDPDRSVRKNHASGLGLGAAAASGSVPPRRARRLALSRSISALSASRSNGPRSRHPVRATALSTS